MRPGERDANDGDGKDNGRDEMAERQPPAGQHQPHEIAENAKRSGTNIIVTGIDGARHRFLTEGEQRVRGDV